MNKDLRPGFAGMSGSGGIALVVLVAGALYFRTVPLETTRPAVNDTLIQQQFAGQDVDARLWQDPFTAVALGIELAAQKAGKSGNADKPVSRQASALGADIDRQITGENNKGEKSKGKKSVEVFAVMLSGGPYAEDVESRRRTRYAVLAALNASRFEPVDSEHLGYFVPADGSPKLPRVVPYEWFVLAADTRPRNDGSDGRRILVMWLDAGAFANKPFEQWKKLVDDLWPKDKPKLNWCVIGPAGSDGLKAMVDEAASLDKPDKKIPPPESASLRFYSATATVPDKALLDHKAVPTCRPISPPSSTAKASTWCARSATMRSWPTA
jgi:hypothetical protein